MEYRDFFKNKRATAKDIQNLIPEGVDPDEFRKGIDTEKEHTDDEFISAKIAGDHLREDPHYYTKLSDAGLEEEGDMEEHCGVCKDDNGNEYDDNGGLPKIGGALAVPHLGQPIRMGKIITVGAIGGGPASGEVSGMSNVGGNSKKTKDKGGISVVDTGGKEPITAGDPSPNTEPIHSDIASKSVGGPVSQGKGQKQGGKNTKGCIAGMSSEIDDGNLDESKQKVRKVVKEVLKEITFDKQSGKWVKLNEAGHKAGCKCAFCANKGKFGKKDKEEVDENATCSKCGKPDKQCKCENVDENTMDMKMGTSYKVVQPTLAKTSEDDFARTNQYEPEISEMYDDEEECMMNERYVELANAQRNLSESELAELKILREKIDNISINKRNFGLSQGGVEPSLYEKTDKWIQKAVDPKHKGYCTPMTKPTCTPRRKALAMRFKKGDLSEADYSKEMKLCESQCEDYPCCGHAPGDCPDSQGRFRCAGGCGRMIPKGSSSSICPSCQRRMSDLDREDPTGQDVEAEFGSDEFGSDESVQEEVNMKMGPAYKKVQQRLYKTSDDDFARKNQYEPEISEYAGIDAGEVEPETSGDETHPFNIKTGLNVNTSRKNVEIGHPGQVGGFKTWQCDHCGYELTTRGGNRPLPVRWKDGHVCHFGEDKSKEIAEAGGYAEQNSSYRTVDNGNLPQDSETRWAHDVDEGKKPSKVSKTIAKGMSSKKRNPHLKFQASKKTSTGVHKRKP